MSHRRSFLSESLTVLSTTVAHALLLMVTPTSIQIDIADIGLCTDDNKY